MCYITHFNTSSPFMNMSVATKINFLGMENFCMLYIASTLPLHSDHFEVLHDILQLCYALNDVSYQGHSLKKLEAPESKSNKNNKKNHNNNNKPIPRTALLAVKKLVAFMHLTCFIVLEQFDVPGSPLLPLWGVLH